MREYRFRGKNKDIGWVYGQLVYDVNENAYIVQNVEQDSSYGLEETMLCATMWYRVDKETVGQYTGLKDKNGKEIYDGDIVKKYYYEYDENFGEIEKYNIEEIKYDADICCFNVSIFDNSEVIGNTTDNQEILKEE